MGKYLSLLKSRLSADCGQGGVTDKTDKTGKTIGSGEFLDSNVSFVSFVSDPPLSTISEKHAVNLTEYESLLQDIRLKDDRGLW